MKAGNESSSSRDGESVVRYRIDHLTAYDYGQAVMVSHQLARLRPLNGGGQVLRDFSLSVTPEPAEVESGHDYFENAVERFFLQESHRRLEVSASSDVEVSMPFIDPKGEGVPWDRLRELIAKDLEGEGMAAMENCFASRLVPVSDEFAKYAAPLFAKGRPFLDAVMELTLRIHEDFTFDPAATTVATPLTEVLEQRRGVCQDFAQLQIACLRSLGLPARYVSGYVRTEPPPGMPRLIGVDAMHAWVSVYCPDFGWVEFDPTNCCVAGNNHVRVGFGRDFSDVSPLRGTVVGGGGQLITIAVTVRPVDEPASLAGNSQSQSQGS